MTTPVSLPRLVFPPLIASLLAATLAWLALGTTFRPIIWQSFVLSFGYALPIHACAKFTVPFAMTRYRAPGPALIMALVVAMATAALAGSMAGDALQTLLRWRAGDSFWRTYFFMARITVVLAVGVGLVAHLYERLTRELRETQRQLQVQEVAQAQAAKQALEARLASLEARIHPHFLFNTLNSLSALIPVDPRRAEALLAQLSVLLRRSLSTTTPRTIPLDDELTVVRAYLEIEQARLGPRLTVAFDVPADVADCAVPPFVVQTLVENAVKHGIAPLETRGRVEIAARHEGAHWHLAIRDSGPGFDLLAVPPGHGLEQVVARLETTFGAAARLEVTRGPGGCTVDVYLPVDPEAGCP